LWGESGKKIKEKKNEMTFNLFSIYIVETLNLETGKKRKTKRKRPFDQKKNHVARYYDVGYYYYYYYYYDDIYLSISISLVVICYYM